MQRVYLVRVITDDGEPQIWLAATERAKAVDYVLDAAPEGWTASLVEGELTADDAALLNMKLGEVRQYRLS